MFLIIGMLLNRINSRVIVTPTDPTITDPVDPVPRRSGRIRASLIPYQQVG